MSGPTRQAGTNRRYLATRRLCICLRGVESTVGPGSRSWVRLLSSPDTIAQLQRGSLAWGTSLIWLLRDMLPRAV